MPNKTIERRESLIGIDYHHTIKLLNVPVHFIIDFFNNFRNQIPLRSTTDIIAIPQTPLTDKNSDTFFSVTYEVLFLTSLSNTEF